MSSDVDITIEYKGVQLRSNVIDLRLEMEIT